ASSTQHLEGILRRAWRAALDGHDGEVEGIGRELAACGVALGEGLNALHGLAARLSDEQTKTGEDGAAPPGTKATLDALRRGTVGIASGYAAALADHRDASLRDTTASLADRRAELAALHRVNAAVNSSLDEHAILTTVVDTVAAVMRSDVCSIYLFQPPN